VSSFSCQRSLACGACHREGSTANKRKHLASPPEPERMKGSLRPPNKQKGMIAHIMTRCQACNGQASRVSHGSIRAVAKARLLVDFTVEGEGLTHALQERKRCEGKNHDIVSSIQQTSILHKPRLHTGRTKSTRTSLLNGEGLTKAPQQKNKNVRMHKS